MCFLLFGLREAMKTVCISMAPHTLPPNATTNNAIGYCLKTHALCNANLWFDKFALLTFIRRLHSIWCHLKRTVLPKLLNCETNFDFSYATALLWYTLDWVLFRSLSTARKTFMDSRSYVMFSASNTAAFTTFFFILLVIVCAPLLLPPLPLLPSQTPRKWSLSCTSIFFECVYVFVWILHIIFVNLSYDSEKKFCLFQCLRCLLAHKRPLRAMCVCARGKMRRRVPF